MPNNGTAVTTEAQPAVSNPLDIVPNEIPFDVPYGLPIEHQTEPRRLFTPPWPKRRSGIGR